MFTSKYWLYVFFILSIIRYPTCVSAETTSLITNIQKNYEAMQNFSATFTQILTHKTSGSQETRKGTFIFKKPLLIRWETQKPHAELLVVTSDTIWNYFPDEQLVYQYSKEIVQDSMAIIQVITGNSRLDKNFTIIPEANDNEFLLLHLYPKEPTTQLVEAWLWISPKSSLIHKAKILDFYGNSNIITFLKITPNEIIDKNIFQFVPPKNVTVESLLDQSVPERPLFN